MSGNNESTTAKRRPSNASDSDNSMDPEKAGGSNVTIEAKKTSKLTPWRKYNSINPLRWRAVPPHAQERYVSKEATAGYLSKATFWWMGDLMNTGYLRPLESSDIPLVAPNRSASVITEKLQAAFQRRRERGDKYPLVWSLNEVFFNEFWFAGASRLFGDVCLIINPFLLKYLIRFAVESYTAIQTGGKGPNLGYGVGLAIVISFIQACVTITLSQFVYLSMMTGGQARAGLIGMVFEKALVISARAKAGGDAAAAFVMVTRAQQERKDKKSDREKGKKKKTKKEEDTGWSNGRVVNLMGTDTYRVDQAAGWFHVIWTAPVMMILTLILLLINLGVAALAGIAVLCVGVPVLSWVVKTIARRRKRMNLITDKRVTLTQEILMGVRFVKYFGWEESFLSRLQELRDREISAVQFLLGIRSAVNAVGMSLPIFASMLAFITYSLTHKDLDAATVFSSLALFNALRFPLNLLPMVAAQTIDAWVSIGRLQEYLLAEEITDRVIYQEDMEPAVLVKDGNFTWERPPPEEEKKKKKTSRKQRRLDALEEKSQPTPITGSSTPLTPFQLEAINLAVGRHELLAVVGSVGSGKSSLLAALAGGMRATGGSVTMSSKIAYCPQYAWIQNATVRENIVFGKEFNQEWYDTVVRACALERDLDMLPDGDMTEIGERGITVSGGQKQRLNIARAIYFNTDIVLMDDPLSAVDALVGRHLFDKAICGMLKDKCRILATHQLHVLEKVDRVMWMEDGRIQAIGTFHELMRENPGFAEMMKEISTDKRDIDDGKTKTDEREEKDEIEVNESEEGDDEKEAEKKVPAKALILMQVEERGSNSVSWKVYESYIKSSGSIWVGPIIIFLLCLGQASNIITTLWLSYWTSDVYGLSNGAYIGIYAGLGVFQSLAMFLFAYSLTIAGTRSSKKLMQKAMQSTLRAPMSFFDTTPIGRITNRFSKDIDVMDNQLTDAIRMYLFTLAIIGAVFVLIIVYFHYFVIALVPLAGFFLFAASYYRASAREVKRHEAVLRSHVFSKFGESLNGIASIRAYGLETRFINTLHSAIDGMNGAYFITFANQRWLSCRLDIIGILLLFTTSILVVTSRFSVNPSIAGVVLSYVLQIVMMLQMMIRQLAEVENAMNATERIHFYGTELPTEAPLRTNTQVHPAWPATGAVEFKDVCMRYRPELPLVLKSLNLTIPGGARVGIVGRTGAGKSSITSALFRLVELASGTILIDGVDISTLGLATLREKLSIIPQDPTLFRGTVRSNLDPFKEHSEAETIAALQNSYLDPSITLDSPVDEEGYNFSLGQRQQLALARALLRGSRVVVADEATSSVDVETDRVIQKSMKEGFEGRTLVVIAHRLRTVVGFDMVVVMEQGEVAEVGRPGELWRSGREGGYGNVWFGMCERGGVSEADFGFEEKL